ncbi:K02A2.6-like [Cordylochernes scorpioides]|uniref:K02A2.6-like n=1 Tax=Cordylochernes scorpioides TaxID=51811 RepID=A0ABY6L2N5_9ARAC|nr:K02A2.6-like [Cordylochernes scorpioides]
MFTPEQNPKKHDSEPVEMVLLMDALDSSPVTSDDIRVILPRHPALRQALDHTLQGCSEETPKEMEFMYYWSRRYELGSCEGLLFWGNRAIIPTNLRAKMLDELHNSHQDIVGLKSVARTLFWCPELCFGGLIWTRILNIPLDGVTPAKAMPACHPELRQSIGLPPTNPGIEFILIIWRHLNKTFGACTKWIEAIPVPNTSTRETIEQLRCLFARFGIPRTLVSDNGTGIESFEAFLLNIERMSPL